MFKFYKVDIAKWIARELHGTRLEILKAEDEMQDAKLRLAALRERERRLAQHVRPEKVLVPGNVRPEIEAVVTRLRHSGLGL